MGLDIVFSIISAVGTIIAIYAACLGIKNTKELKRQKEVNLIIDYKSILFRACGGVSWCHLIRVNIINTATVSAVLQGVSLNYRGKLCEAMRSNSPIVLPPNQSIEYCFFIDISGGILDGHYDVQVNFHTNIGDWESILDESTQSHIFIMASSDESFNAQVEDILPFRIQPHGD